VTVAEHMTPRADVGGSPARTLRRRLAVVVLVVAAACAAAGAWLYAGLPGVGDAGRRVVAELRAHREAVSAGPLPERVAAAVVAVEDERYWHHGAIDPIAIGRAVLEGIAHPGQDTGGSTIAQQLATDLYLGGDRSALGALRAVGLAFKLEHRYSKARILAMYVDSVYLGHGYWGIDAASRGYFGTSPQRLTWGQASLLAGLPQAPSADDPVLHFAAARARQRHVLRQLVANDDLTAPQAALAYAHTPRPR
jgi:membrane peptidoglycan carboxypeptidase